MTRRSTPQAKIDDIAFPIRIAVLVPERGFGSAGIEHNIPAWLKDEVGPSNYAVFPKVSMVGDATSFYFRHLEDAVAFFDRFPMLVLADGTMGRGYTSPQMILRDAERFDMCNLYSMTRTQDEMRELFAGLEAAIDLGNFGGAPEIYPDYAAPILRTGTTGREIVLGRWGMPTPPQFLIGKKTDRGVTNIRNTKSPHWRRWLGPENRCLVPFTMFAEPDVRTSSPRQNVWFGAGGEVAFFAGIWTSWTSVRKVKEGETTDDLFGFLTTEPNAEVAPVHPKAMPVILTDPAEWETWLTAPWAEAARLQRPLPDGALSVLDQGPVKR